MFGKRLDHLEGSLFDQITFHPNPSELSIRMGVLNHVNFILIVSIVTNAFL